MYRKLTVIFLSVIVSASVFAQSGTRGTVLDESGEPLAGVAVYTQVNGKTVSALTDAEGKFSIDVPSATPLTFSSLGLETLELAAAHVMEVVLKQNRTVLDESVVIGYGTVKKKDLLGSVSTVREQSLQDRTAGGVVQSLTSAMTISSKAKALGRDLKI